MCTARQLAKQLLRHQPMVVYTVTWMGIHGIQKEEPPDALSLRRYDGFEIKKRNEGIDKERLSMNLVHLAVNIFGMSVTKFHQATIIFRTRN